VNSGNTLYYPFLQREEALLYKLLPIERTYGSEKRDAWYGIVLEHFNEVCIDMTIKLYFIILTIE
jgi:hypothetical protein